MAPGSVLWELRGKSGMTTSCYLHRLTTARVAIVVTMGDNEIMREHFAVERDAVVHADFLRRDFSDQGWTETYRRDA